MSKSKQPKKTDSTFPSAIRVLGTVYEIHVHKNLAGKENIHGDCDTEKRIIRLSEDAPPAMLSTLFHESLHAAFSESGINALISLKVEEAIVSMLEKYLEGIVNLEKNLIVLPNSEEAQNGNRGKTQRSRVPANPRKASSNRKTRQRGS